MATSGTVNLTAKISEDTNGTVVQRLDVLGVDSDVVGQSGQRQTIAIASGFNALTVPSGASCVVIQVMSGAVTLTLKGVTGDTGIVLQSGTLTSFPICIPLGTSPSLGIDSDGTASLDVLYL